MNPDGKTSAHPIIEARYAQMFPTLEPGEIDRMLEAG